MDAVGELIRRRGLRQRDAAKLFGVTQPRVSDAVRGKVALFTVDTLVEMLAAAGITVEIEMHERKEPGNRERDRTAGNPVRGRRHSGE